MLPTISIIMPVLNREDTIEKAIQSVLNQQYENIELIILDGGSSDQTVNIIKQYETHLTYWHSERDGSAAAATNVGIQKAKGDLIALLMADDWFEPGTFHQIAKAYQQSPDADMFTCAGRIVTNDKNNYVVLKTYNTAKRMQLNFYNICFDITSAICCRFIKRSLYERIGIFIPFDEKGDQFLTNDKEFLLRAVLNKAKDVFVNHLGHTYLAHKESFSFANNQAISIKHCHEHMQIVNDYLKNKPLSKSQKYLLIAWYHDQAARLVMYKLLEKKFNVAAHIFKNTFKRYPILCPIIFSYTAIKIISKRSLRKLRSCLFKYEVMGMQ